MFFIPLENRKLEVFSCFHGGRNVALTRNRFYLNVFIAHIENAFTDKLYALLFFSRSPVSVAAAAIYLASQASEEKFKKSQKGMQFFHFSQFYFKIFPAGQNLLNVNDENVNILVLMSLLLTWNKVSAIVLCFCG